LFYQRLIRFTSNAKYLRNCRQPYDTGDPAGSYGGQVDIDGQPRFMDGDCNGAIIVDMGAYEFAWVYLGDLDGDCDVDFVDFGIFAGNWLAGL